MSTRGRLPSFTWLDNPRNAGGDYAPPSYYNYKPVILLHMTVSSGISANYIRGHTVPPHLWYNVYTDDAWQTVELDRAAYALYQPQYGYHWCNKHAYLLQTELIGVPVVNQTTYTDAQCRKIAEKVIVPQVLWLRSIGLDVNLNDFRYHTNSSGSASVDWPGRMSEQEMADFNGVMAHIDAWGNDHWDCSVERVDLMCQYAREILGTGTKPKGWLDMLTDEQQIQLYNWVQATFWATGNQMPKAGVPTLADRMARIEQQMSSVYWMVGNTDPKAGIETVSADARAARKNTDQLLASSQTSLFDQEGGESGVDSIN